jgi:hypothetical protein
MAHRITPDDVHRFTQGDCHIFARALNKATGWPIHTFRSWGGTDMHAFVRAPDGRCVDIQGFTRVTAFKCRWGLRNIAPIDWKDLRDEWGGPNFGDHSYRRAKQLVPLVLEQA